MISNNETAQPSTTRKNRSSPSNHSKIFMIQVRKEDIKIYVVSLPCDTARRDTIKKQFPKTSTLFNFFSAVDLRDPNSPISESASYQSKATKMTSAEIGCTLSHIKVMKKFLSSQEKSCLILEDDIEGGDQDIENAIKFTRNLPAGGIALLGGLQGLKNRKYVYGKPISETTNFQTYKIHNLCRIFLARTCCYSITRDAAESIIQKQEKKLIRADQWDELLKKDNEIYYLDLLTHPTDLTSSHIEKGRKNQKNTFLSRIYSDGIYRAIRRILTKPYVYSFLRFYGYRNVPSKSLFNTSK